MVAALLAAAGVKAGGLQVAVRERRNPDVGPRRRDDERLDAGQRVLIAHRLPVGIGVAEAGARLHTAAARAAVCDVAKAGGARGLLGFGDRVRSFGSVHRLWFNCGGCHAAWDAGWEPGEGACAHLSGEALYAMEIDAPCC